MENVWVSYVRLFVLEEVQEVGDYLINFLNVSIKKQELKFRIFVFKYLDEFT